jgi:ferredoxin-NADP reductase
MILKPLSYCIKQQRSMAHPTHPHILQWVKEIAPNVRHLSFVREDQAPFDFVPGQFITLHIEGANKTLHRSYSIANTPGSTSIEITCSYVKDGRASEFLFRLQPGDIVQANGPYGLLVLKDEQPSRYILVATGTGVTPYRAMLNEIEKRLQIQPSLEKDTRRIIIC